MIGAMRLFATCAVLLALACSTPAQQPPAAPASAGTGTDAAARVGSRTITLSEVDERWQKTAPASRAQAMQQLYDGRREALEAIVAEMLIAEAAKAKGLDPAKYSEAEVARRVQPVTEGQVIAFYQENQAQMQGRALAAMSPAIRRYLEEQQQSTAYRAMVNELRKAGPRVEMVIDAPRYEVAIAPDDPSVGAASAPVTVVEFSDFQCPFCQRVMPTLKKLREAYGDRVRIVWKDFPLTAIHPQAFKAAEAGQCAKEQGKFWELHDRMFANQQALQPEFLKKYAGELGLDAAKFNACLDMAKYAERVQEHMGIGNALGVSSTPSVFINGRLVAGAHPYETFAAVVDEELDRKK
jgi:protein-disulfide isomerase